MFCPRCGTENVPEARYCSRCGEALVTVDPAGTMTAATAPAPTVAARREYAGFWRRFAAILIDWLVLSVPTGFTNLVFGLSMFPFFGRDNSLDPAFITGAAALGWFWSWFLSTVFAWIYFALMESSTFQATLGKLALGIAVTDLEGRRISFARATGRYFGKYVSAMIAMIGFLMAAFTEKKQALHDILADTLVVQK